MDFFLLSRQTLDDWGDQLIIKSRLVIKKEGTTETLVLKKVATQKGPFSAVGIEKKILKMLRASSFFFASTPSGNHI